MGDETSKSLKDSDIATRQRRTGPEGTAPGTDADTQAHTDSDVAPTSATDHDAATDRD